MLTGVQVSVFVLSRWNFKIKIGNPTVFFTDQSSQIGMAKRAFERSNKSFGISVLPHYHTGNEERRTTSHTSYWWIGAENVNYQISHGRDCDWSCVPLKAHIHVPLFLFWLQSYYILARSEEWLLTPDSSRELGVCWLTGESHPPCRLPSPWNPRKDHHLDYRDDKLPLIIIHTAMWSRTGKF